MTILLVALLLWTNPPTPIDPAPGAATLLEARCTDGTLVRVTLRTSALPVQTKYGLLTIPLRDVRRVELGLHFPAGIEERVQQAVRCLGGISHREREAAEAELIALGEYAYAAVHAAAKAKDLEQAERAERVLAKLKEQVPADRLRLDPRDRIETAEFTVLGRITQPIFQGRSTLFGDVELKLADVRVLRRADGAGDQVVSVDAAKYGLPGGPWLETGLEVEAGRRVTLTATGQVDLWPQGPGQYVSGPAGYRNAGTVQGTNHHAGALLGRIGEGGKVFVIGETVEMTPDTGGRLYLAVAPSPWNNPTAGGYVVRAQGR